MHTWHMWKVCLQTFRNKRICWKLAYDLRNLQISQANNSRILRIVNAKFSGYCFYMNTNREVFKSALVYLLVNVYKLINLKHFGKRLQIIPMSCAFFLSENKTSSPSLRISSTHFALISVCCFMFITGD